VMNMESNVREKVLRAFLTEVILGLLSHHHATGYEIVDSIAKEFGIRIGPNVIYTKLASMERSKLIACLQHSRKRTYSLTEKGRKMLEAMPETINEIQRSVLLLLRNSVQKNIKVNHLSNLDEL